MIFWILVVAAVIVVGTFFVRDYILPKVRYHNEIEAAKAPGAIRDRWSYGPYDRSDLETTGISAFISGVSLGVATIVLLPLTYAYQTGAVVISEEKVGLSAIKTTEQTEGRVTGSIFLTGGYISETPAFSYISEDEGAYRLDWADASKSVVYQDEEDNPSVTVREYDFYSAWLVPWSIATEPRYEFHVPEGSVVASYEITP